MSNETILAVKVRCLFFCLSILRCSNYPIHRRRQARDSECPIQTRYHVPVHCLRFCRIHFKTISNFCRALPISCVRKKGMTDGSRRYQVRAFWALVLFAHDLTELTF